MNNRIYITYCCKNKHKLSHNLPIPVSELYISRRIQNFIAFCNSQNYNWGIFSDLYGLVLSSEKISVLKVQLLERITE